MTMTFRHALIAAALLTAAPAFAQPAAGPTPTTDTAAPTPPPTPTSPAPTPPAPTPPAPPPAPVAAPTPPPVSPPAVAGTIGAPPEGKGQIVFFRPSAFTGMAVFFKVRENGVELGKLTNGVYFVQVEEPGPHTFTAATENKDTLRLEVEPGETYYVKGGISMGLVVGEANLSPSDQAAFEKAVKKMKLAKPPEPPKPAKP